MPSDAMKRLLATAILFWVFCVRAWAHPVDVGRLTATVGEDTIRFQFEASAILVADIAVVDLDKLTPDGTSGLSRALFLNTLGQTAVMSGGSPCAWGEPRAERIDDAIRLRVTASCKPPLGAWRLELPMVYQAPPSFQLLVKVESGGVSRESVVSASGGAELKEIGGEGAAGRGWRDFVPMGVKHIGAWPTEWWSGGRLHLPDGIDHILFLVALILGGGGLWMQLKTVTGFTVGHSITLALAALGLVAVPSRWAESAIAFSIAFVVVESLLQSKPHSRWPLAFGFGLVHGLGFASALAELHLAGRGLVTALLGFNVGVEFGQGVVLCCVFPVLAFASRYERVRLAVTRVALAGIAVAGGVWFVQRAFGLG
jgi:hypothetical protein